MRGETSSSSSRPSTEVAPALEADSLPKKLQKLLEARRVGLVREHLLFGALTGRRVHEPELESADKKLLIELQHLPLQID
jgi:hypothetical protein